jgi:hypothetical protein
VRRVPSGWALFFGFRPLSEALHIRSAATSLASEPEIASPWVEAIMLIKAQRTGIVGIAVVVAIGLIWSVAVMSKWVPVASAETRSAAVIQP